MKKIILGMLIVPTNGGFPTLSLTNEDNKVFETVIEDTTLFDAWVISVEGVGDINISIDMEAKNISLPITEQIVVRIFPNGLDYGSEYRIPIGGDLEAGLKKAYKYKNLTK